MSVAAKGVRARIEHSSACAAAPVAIAWRVPPSCLSLTLTLSPRPQRVHGLGQIGTHRSDL
jgi:hypothetical protein